MILQLLTHRPVVVELINSPFAQLVQTTEEFVSERIQERHELGQSKHFPFKA